MSLFALALCLLCAAPALLAQPDRLSRPVDHLRSAPLRGNRTPRVRTQDDQGRLSPLARLEGMRLRVKPSPAQAAEMERLLAEQQDPASPNYRNWLTPEQYADRFGLSPSDLSLVRTWLEARGFTVDYVAKSRAWLGFSGTAELVEKAFRTEIHRYSTGGESHYANASDPFIPADLLPLVQVVRGLDDFRIQPTPRNPRPLPLMSGNGAHVLGPADLAAIYNVAPLYRLGIDGSGQKIAVISGSAIKLSDIQTFRATFGVPKDDPRQVLVPGFPDPGVVTDAEREADLDLQYAGGIAPGATLLNVYSSDVSVALEYAIDQNLAPVISTSWGVCEAAGTSGSADFAAWQNLAQQANLQGATWVAASGDSGAAGCDPHQKVQVASYGLGVQLPSSLPEVTAVGGTGFNDSTGVYWSATNGAGQLSALGYIPEVAWNDTALDTSLGGGLASTGGGASSYFPKPAWQTGTGVPAADQRYVPDVSFAASWDHDPYAVVQGGTLVATGGTSAATPVFAGVLALLNQYLVSNRVLAKAGLGNINPALYGLAQGAPTIFHDIAAGGNIVPCVKGTPDCSGGQFGYNAAAGYDLATGLGSIDVQAMVTQWNDATLQPAIPTVTSLGASPATLTTGATAVLTATVKASSGAVSPTGTVTFILGKTALGSAGLSGAGGSATATLTIRGSQLTVGGNTITASYGGSASFSASSGAAAVTVTVSTTASAVIPSAVPNPVYQQPADADGYSFFFTLRLSEIAGSATTLTAFAIDGTDRTAEIPAYFGAAEIPANGTIFASLRDKIATVPATRVYDFAGVDAGGQKWSQQLAVPFYPRQLSASMALSSSPATETIQDAGGDARCSAGYPYYQQLNLQEKNGYGVLLNRFSAGGSDLTSHIGAWFGTLHLAPFGALQTGICWKVANAPTTLNYEIAGVDTAGNKISATLQVPFQGVGQSAGALSVSKSAIGLSAGSQSSLSVTVPAGQEWSVSVFPANRKTSWLVVSPVSGTGPAQVNLAAPAVGIASGAYTATLVFESVNTIPQFVNVPVTLVVGASGSVSISGFANGASFQAAVAPGMILSVFGKNLANSTVTAPSVPLPTLLDGVSVTVNGVAAPLYFVSPTQLNVQVPYETVTSTAIVAVNNNGQVAAATFPVKASAPGIFVDEGGRIAPASSARPGDAVVLYVTGEGDVSPAVATGAPPLASLPVSQLPAPLLPVSLSVGGVSVTPAFVGIPYGLVGVTQVNFTVPSGVPAGDQPVVVTVGGVSSPAAKLLVITQ